MVRNKILVGISIDKEISAEFKSVCQINHYKISGIMEELITRWLNEKRERNNKRDIELRPVTVDAGETAGSTIL